MLKPGKFKPSNPSQLNPAKARANGVIDRSLVASGGFCFGERADGSITGHGVAICNDQLACFNADIVGAKHVSCFGDDACGDADTCSAQGGGGAPHRRELARRSTEIEVSRNNGKLSAHSDGDKLCAGSPAPLASVKMKGAVACGAQQAA